MYLSGDPEADAFLEGNPLALLLGMLLDQQIPMEWAFRGPHALSVRLGAPLEAGLIADMDPEKLQAVFAEKPAIHRYPASMATRTQAVCRHLVDHYDGNAEALWVHAPSGDELLRALKAVPGFGDMKARIFIALLGKQCGLTVPGWQKVSTPYSDKGSLRSVADIVDAETLEKVRAHKAAMKKAAKSAT